VIYLSKLLFIASAFRKFTLSQLATRSPTLYGDRFSPFSLLKLYFQPSLVESMCSISNCACFAEKLPVVAFDMGTTVADPEEIIRFTNKMVR
jgi:hypothetical protein